MKKRRLFLTSVMVIAISMHCTSLEAQERTVDNPTGLPTKIVTTKVKMDVVDWRYKLVGNKLYKRLYNYSRQEWIGYWILC